MHDTLTNPLHGGTVAHRKAAMAYHMRDVTDPAAKWQSYARWWLLDYYGWNRDRLFRLERIARRLGYQRCWELCLKHGTLQPDGSVIVAGSEHEAAVLDTL